MSNIIDIPAVVPALVSFFTMGGTDAAITLAQGVLSNTALKIDGFLKLIETFA